MSRDVWKGDELRPLSMNGWSYVEGNPVNYSDPSGYWPKHMLDNVLGDDWQSVYFIGSCNRGIFAGRDRLYQFLISEKTHDIFTLDFIRETFETARVLSFAGLSFDADSPIDAIGFSVRGSSGEIVYGGFAGEGLLNTNSGEFSLFVAPEVGVIIISEIGLMGGPFIVKNLPSNVDYRNYFGSVGVAGGHHLGGNIEAFWSAPKTSPIEDGTHGGFVGGGFAELAGVYGGYAFFYEILRVDESGYHFLPDPFNYRPDDLITIIRDDVLGTLSDYSSRLFGMNH